MNRYAAAMRIMHGEDNDKTLRNAAIIAIAVQMAIPLLIVILIAATISLPVNILKDVLTFLIGEGCDPADLYIIQQIRPDLLLNGEQTVVEGHEYGLPINRTIQHYFGETIGSRTLDYLSYNCDGDNLFAIADGQIVEIDSSEALGGFYIVVEHDAPEDDDANVSLFSKYWAVDMNAEHMEVGDYVEQGDIIGQALSADQSRATMIFCFQMYGDSDYEPIDPLPYIGSKYFEEEVEAHFSDQLVIIGNSP